VTRFSRRQKTRGFWKTTKKKRLEIDPTSGEEVAALVREVMSQPPDVVEQLKKLMGR
jgi:hypothetical protein